MTGARRTRAAARTAVRRAALAATLALAPVAWGQAAPHGAPAAPAGGPAGGAAGGVVEVAPGDDVVRIVAAAPAGTTFRFAPGVYRLTTPIVPAPHDAFLGTPPDPDAADALARGGTILDGSVVLPPAERHGDVWTIDDPPPYDGDQHGSCMAAFLRCDYRQDLYLDGDPLLHVASTEHLGPGRWTYDFDANRILIGEDPAGRTAALGVAEAALRGNANHVRIEDLTVRHFANPAQRGAIHAYGDRLPVTPGHAWEIRRVTADANHGVGLMAGYGAVIADSRALRNGQLGIMSQGGQGTRVVRNEIAHNNLARFTFHWEGAGTKFRDTRDLVIRDNVVHHNHGPGIWCDRDNVGAHYVGNRVVGNASTGIFHEISYGALIEHNEVVDNGRYLGESAYAYVFGSGILVYNSPNVEVRNNVVVGNWNGINGLMHDRGTGLYGPWTLANLHVHDNVVHLPYHPRGMGPQDLPGQGGGVQAVAGISQAGGLDGVYTDAANNRFEGNLYLLEDPNADAWTWGDRGLTFDEWRTCGADDHDHRYPGCAQDPGAQVRFVAPGSDVRAQAERWLEALR